MYLLSAYFDEATNACLVDLIKKCHKISGNSFMVKNKVPPHVTLLQFQTKSTLDEVKKKFHDSSFPKRILPVVFGSFGFEIPGVYCLSIKKDLALENLSNIFFEEFSGIPETIFNRTYLPKNFYPHVTLAKTLSGGQRKSIEDFLKNPCIPKDSRLVSISLTVGKPAVELDRVELGV